MDIGTFVFIIPRKHGLRSHDKFTTLGADGSIY